MKKEKPSAKEKKSLSAALAEIRTLEPCFYWRLLYQDRPFTEKLIHELNRRISRGTR